MLMDDARVDIKDVAAAAGVSTATASYSFTGRGRVSEATRARVLQVASQLGYVPNHLARGLRRQRSETVALIGDDIVTTPWAVRMIGGAQDAVKAHGSLLLIVSTGGDPDLEQREVNMLRERRVDGVIYASMYHRVVTVPPELKSTAVILLDATCADDSLPSVVPDEEAGARAAMGELLAAGHRRIGFINNEDDIPASRGRLRGVYQAAAEAGLHRDDVAVVNGPATPEGGYRGAIELLRRSRRPTGIFCFSDRIAVGCYHAAADRRLSIPADLSVVGFDDVTLIAETLRPNLTTVSLPHYEMGVWAVDQLYSRLNVGAPEKGGGDIPHEQIEGSVVRRRSVAPPAET
jgi:LacI family transcriptional regulator